MLTIQKLENKKIKAGRLSDLTTFNVVWLDSIKPDDEELHKITKTIGLDTATIKEFLRPEARPTLIEIKKYSVIVMKAPVFVDKRISTAPVIVIISKYNNNFITIHDVEIRSIERLNALDEKGKTAMFSKGPTFMFYRLVDEMMNTYYTLLDNIGDELEVIEKLIFKTTKKDITKEIFAIKKTLIYFHKALIANREVISSIEKEYISFFDNEDLKKFRLLYGDIMQLVDMSTTYRDILTTTLDVYMSSVSNTLNITVKKLLRGQQLFLFPA